CSSGQHFASGFLQIRSHPRHPCLWLTLPLAGCVEDFHLPVTSVATTAKLVALARNAPCLAHQKKKGAGYYPAHSSVPRHHPDESPPWRRPFPDPSGLRVPCTQE
ncbi:hypothetical protein IPC759_07950, partial [Pseudomonas aeruginosa]